MRSAKVVALLLLVLSLLGGGTSYVSEIYERHYYFAMYDGAITTSEVFTACSSANALTASEGRSWCIAMNGETQTLRSLTIVVIADVTGATEDCTFTIETSTDLSTLVSVSSSAISTGSNLTNAAGTCAAGSLVLDTIGEFCTRTLDDGVTLEPGHGWRLAISTTATCTSTQGLAAHVVSIVQ